MDKKSLSIQTVWQDEHIMREKMKLGHQTDQGGETTLAIC